MDGRTVPDRPKPREKRLKLPVIPAAAFGIVLGIAGLASSWRAGSSLWGLPILIGQGIGLLGVLIWAVLIVLFSLKWVFFIKQAEEELLHPVQCCFVGLLGVATMLVGPWVDPLSDGIGKWLFWLGAAWTAGFALWRTGALWRGGRDHATTTPVLYLPTVAGSYVIAISGASFGYDELAQFAFGAGFFSWLAIESVLLNRLLTAQELPESLRPTIGIQLAPPAVGTAAYLSATNGNADMLAHAMLGYAFLQFLLLIRLLPWVFEQAFSASYWAFSFGLTAMATAVLKMADRGSSALLASLAGPIFVLVNTLLLVLVFLSLWHLVSGKLFSLQRIGT
ncbi:dicarboxylate transporter/tellurite-resistance protein TehA [Neorhizobium galegae]|uniref:dicarboxylate transporter/tellurite-resistance protein TehA n=1 Tax=Neorhizobium galegae TaxID=399 RepID=UPI002104AC44|nr:dicarboxylate transporter/tellurite-resistance protein TehA [Neorhizobium galegae]MCQ1775826.1 dicarboxylate transporter/tellurite-resistance protein TehA [Neorhizobium galegae]MCQ1797999.1 dicarboxylate transporter/tellurite-resistance protein TehA [Neorhizobium galegae]